MGFVSNLLREKGIFDACKHCLKSLPNDLEAGYVALRVQRFVNQVHIADDRGKDKKGAHLTPGIRCSSPIVPPYVSLTNPFHKPAN